MAPDDQNTNQPADPAANAPSAPLESTSDFDAAAASAPVSDAAPVEDAAIGGISTPAEDTPVVPPATDVPAPEAPVPDPNAAPETPDASAEAPQPQPPVGGSF